MLKLYVKYKIIGSPLISVAYCNLQTAFPVDRSKVIKKGAKKQKKCVTRDFAYRPLTPQSQNAVPKNEQSKWELTRRLLCRVRYFLLFHSMEGVVHTMAAHNLKSSEPCAWLSLTSSVFDSESAPPPLCQYSRVYYSLHHY